MRARARATDEAPPCTDCGACCFSIEPEYIRVFGVDLDRMGPRARGHLSPSARSVLFSEGRCSALRLDEAPGPFSCGIYAERPDACRWLEPGSGACATQREQKGLVAVEALTRARNRSG